MAIADSFDSSFQVSLPLPLARLYTRAYHAKSPRDRHDLAFHLLEASLKLSTAALAARYRHQGSRLSKVDAALEHLALPSLGHWREMFVESLTFLSNTCDGDPWAQRMLEHVKKEPGDNSLEEIHAAMTHAAGRSPRRNSKITLLNLLELLPAYRNAMSGAHGSIKADPEAYSQVTPALLGLAARLHHANALLGGGHLVYAEDVRVGNQGEQRVVWMELQGLAAIRRQALEGEVTTESVLPGRLYLEITLGDHLPLHPFLHYQPGEMLDQVFFLNRASQGRGGVQFLSYSTGDFYVPDRDPVGKYLVRDLREFLSWVTRREVDAAALEALSEASRSDALSKGEAVVTEVEPTGKILGDFEILGELGQGGMAVVYAARQRSLGRLVGLKVLPAALSEDPVALARFKQEIRALARCDHSNVVKVLSSGEVDGACYYAMEFIDGGDLASIGEDLRRFRQSGVLLREGHFDQAASSVASASTVVSRQNLPDVERHDPKPVLEITEGREIAYRLAEVVRDAARGVQHIHDQGIVHRDLKPQNIMVIRHDHRPVIMDLGLAKVRGTSQSLTLDKASILGTLRYMPPEQLQRNLLEVDARADVYALGAVLYELACQRPMLDGETEERLTTQILFEEPPPPRRANPGLPTDLATIITKATRKDPRERYTSAAELAEDLDRLVRGEAITARPVTIPYVLKLFLKRHPVAMALGSSAIVVIIALLAAWVVSLRSAWHREREAALEKESLYLASQSRAALPSNPGRALLLAIEAALRGPGAQANNALLASLEALQERKTLLGHGEAVISAQFSPDGQRIVTASRDKTARIWDAASGTELSTLRHGHQVLSAQFSRDGQRIVTASVDRRVRIWDTASGTELVTLSGHEGGVHSAQFSGDGQRIVTASRDKTARVWDAMSRKELFTLGGHEDAVWFAQFSPDGRLIVTASSDNTARIWDAGSGRELFTLSGHVGEARSAEFSSDGQRIVTASLDKTARIWDTASGKELFTLSGHEGSVQSAQLSPDGQRIVTASLDKTARIWDTTSGKELFTLSGHESGVSSAQFSRDGQRIVTASSDSTARIWDVASGRELFTLRGHGSIVGSAQFSPDGHRIVTTSYDNTARIWDAASGKEHFTLSGHEGGVHSAQFSRDGQRIVTASSDRTARVWDAVSRKELVTLRGHEDIVWSAHFSRDGQRIVTRSHDRTARTWHTESGKELFTFREQGGDFLCTQCSPDGQRIVTVSPHDKLVTSPNGGMMMMAGHKVARIWDAPSGTELFTLNEHEGLVRSAGFSPDGQRIVTACDNKKAQIWDAISGKELFTLKGHEGIVWSARFSPDGLRVITASSDKTARIWEAASGKELFTLSGHEDEVRSAEFSPDSQLVVTASHDRTARIWDVASGTELFTLNGHWSHVRSAEFSPEGKRVITASSDKTARIWNIDLLVVATNRKPREFTPDERDSFDIGSPAERLGYRRRWEAARSGVRN